VITMTSTTGGRTRGRRRGLHFVKMAAVGQKEMDKTSAVCK
jgi:hypothetical protein